MKPTHHSCNIPHNAALILSKSLCYCQQSIDTFMSFPIYSYHSSQTPKSPLNSVHTLKNVLLSWLVPQDNLSLLLSRSSLTKSRLILRSESHFKGFCSDWISSSFYQCSCALACAQQPFPCTFKCSKKTTKFTLSRHHTLTNVVLLST